MFCISMNILQSMFCIPINIIQSMFCFVNSSYVVVTPTSFRPGVPLNISVNILKDVGDVAVTATLVNSGTKDDVAMTKGMFAEGEWNALFLPIAGLCLCKANLSL